MEISVIKLDGAKLLANADFAEILSRNGIASFKTLWNIPSQPVKNILRHRGTERVFLKTPDGTQIEAYIKRYLPDPLKEKIKNFLSMRPNRYPGALNEWNAILEFHKNGLQTMLPAACASDDGKSCILTVGIRNYIRASDVFAKSASLGRERRRKIIKTIAELAARMHSAGMAHQDFYLVHMFIREDEDDKVYLIDLQRTVFKEDFSRRWRIKDLGQLLFSAGKCVSRSDIMFFWKTYSATAGEDMYRDRKLISQILRKTETIRRKS